MARNKAARKEREEERLDLLESLYLEPDDLLRVPDPLAAPFDPEDPLLDLLRYMRRPENFWFTCKHLLGRDLFPMQCVILREIWGRKFPMLIGSRGLGKSFLLGVYAILRATLVQGSKIVVTGSGFRQSKGVFSYAEKIWHESNMLRDVFSSCENQGPSHDADKWILRVGSSTIVALPVGTGEKIRGERANVILVDEFHSLDPVIFETVITGFGAVSLEPVQKMYERGRIRRMKREGRWTADMQAEFDRLNVGNQMVISGTASYRFNHFFSYWELQKAIVESGGDIEEIVRAYGGDRSKVKAGFNWKNYSIIRIPSDLIPDGVMDNETIERARMRQTSDLFGNEYGAVFADDTHGFFPMSLIDSCTTYEEVTPHAPDAEPVKFAASIRGDLTRRHVISVDPAATQDNFAIVVLELHEKHRRVVHCWTTTMQAFHAKAAGDADATYYGYCARKIRELMRAYPTELVCIDAQGGGRQIADALHESKNMEEGDLPLWPIAPGHPLHNGKEGPYDAMAGPHVIELCQFGDAKYTYDANHNLKKDLEDRVLLFPGQDAVALAIDFEVGLATERAADEGLERCYAEIEELKRELTTITHTQTPGTMRDHWDTPETKTPGGRKGRLRKDRYSALVMGNWAAKRLAGGPRRPVPPAWGGFAEFLTLEEGPGDSMLSQQPDWLQRAGYACWEDAGVF